METTDMGLSSLHISTQTVVIEPSKVRYYARGSLATVNRTIIEKACVRCDDRFKVAQWEEDRHLLCRKCLKELKNSDEPIKRGEVTRFSEDSRRRLMRLLATVDSESRPHLVTLTFPDSYTGYRNPEDWKRILNVFVMRFIRQFPGGSFIWRLETIDRKSGVHIGEIFPHFHLLVFGVEFNQLRNWVPGAWFEVVNTGDPNHLKAGTQVARILSRRGIFRYASKTVGENMSREMGKAVQALGKVGRWWGIVVRENFERFISPIEELEIEEGESVQVIRYFRRLAHGFGRAYSRLTTFISGSWLVKNLVRMITPSAGANSYRSTGRNYQVPFWLHAYNLGLLVPQLE